ncbi:Ribonuclease III [Lasiodiplodia theobromae]|uniref:Ribonuclease 3 n=1 Tax=Lasiodiplodia theobromae TaxID=45133 RepID=A0A5N5D7J1_9PEZI|nr:Ribonuclease 3 [Lasiodiplodia theobromae]KAF9631801.1 Ribonuclease III [Lasiodiplodia theobromae]
MKHNGGGPGGSRNAKRPRTDGSSHPHFDKGNPHKRSRNSNNNNHNSNNTGSNRQNASAPNLAATMDLPTPLPPLPTIHDPASANLVFTHTSVTNYATETYDRLEWYGDSVIEMVATDLLWDMYPSLPGGRLSQMREALVNNARLASFARGYGFDQIEADGNGGRLRVSPRTWHGAHATNQTKILGDVFEAYVGAVALEDRERNKKKKTKDNDDASNIDTDTTDRADRWLRQLWTPLLLSSAIFADESDKAGEQVKMRASRAFAPSGSGLKAWYEDVGEMTYENKAQQRFSVAFYLSGWGHDRLRLGEGVGQNKKIARARAAQDALDRISAVPELREHTEKVEAYLAERKAKKEAEEAERQTKREAEETEKNKEAQSSQ